MKKLVFDGEKKLTILDRLVFLLYGDIHMSIWHDAEEQEITFKIQTRKLSGEWDESTK